MGRLETAADHGRIYVELEAQGNSWLFNVKPRAISLAVDGGENYTFDREGRPYAAFVEGRNYRRGMDGRVLVKHRHEPAGRAERVRSQLDAGGTGWFLYRVRQRLDEFAATVARNASVLNPDQQSLLQAWLARLRRWDAAALQADVGRFHSLYQTVSILPPDQYLALVVQSSEGCPWNRCTFCRLYRDRRFRHKSGEELARHVHGIVEWLGEGLWLRRSVFLGDANLLWGSAARLAEVLSSVNDYLTAAGGPVGAYYGFADAAGALRHQSDQLRVLRRLGLRRLYLGLETGHGALRRHLDKPGSPADMVRAVRHLHASGLQVGVIVLLGVGGTAQAEPHERDTVHTLDAMDLGAGDIIYFSPLMRHDEPACCRDGGQSGAETMDYAAMRQQQQRMTAGLRFTAARPSMSLYDIRDFVY